MNTKCLAQLGDVNPIDYGGIWVLTGDDGRVEVEVLTVPDGEDGCKYTVHRFEPEQCTYINGVLSDNKFHTGHPAWFADKIDAIQSCCGCDNLIEALCSDDAITRSQAYLDIASYFGLDEFDQYPIDLTRKEVKSRYSEDRYLVRR